VQKYQFAQTGAIHAAHPFHVKHDFSGMLQGLPHHARKNGRFVPVHDAACTMDNDGVA